MFDAKKPVKINKTFVKKDAQVMLGKMVKGIDPELRAEEIQFQFVGISDELNRF